MGVLFLMAIYAFARRIAKLNLRLVTAVAIDLDMAALEFEIGPCMIEDLPVQPDNICIPTNVIRMAVATFGLTNILIQAMKPLLLR